MDKDHKQDGKSLCYILLGGSFGRTDHGKDTTTAVPYRKSFTVGGKTYNDVFILKPDETADINFPIDELPEGEEFVSYKVIECGVNTAVYDGVNVNGTDINGTEVSDSEGHIIQDRKDYGIDFDSTENRAQVVYTTEYAKMHTAIWRSPRNSMMSTGI